MGSPIQIGDVIHLGKAVWDLYNLGWSEELQASRQYTEFWQSVRGLAENLDNIGRVISNAVKHVEVRRMSTTLPAWNFTSIQEIVGDYRATLLDCRRLLEENQQYRHGGSGINSIEWNMLLQPKVDRLQQRIQMHNEKITFLLKPLEIDLLCRIHEDLANRIDAVFREVRMIRGMVVPDPQQGKEQLDSQEAPSLPVPPTEESMFQAASEIGHPELRDSDDFPLSEGSEAFILHFKNATSDFQPGIFLHERSPPPEQYLNLLKCVWILRKLQESPRLRHVESQSHWPSFIKQLELSLTQECLRFTPQSPNQLTAPSLDTLSAERFDIWPAQEIPDILSPSHTDQGMMDELLVVPLAGTSTTSSTLQVLRSGNSRLRIVETAVERTSEGRSRTASRPLDLRLDSTKVMPLYAKPGIGHGVNSLIIRTESSATQLTFANRKDLLKFQHTVTGYRPFVLYDRPNCQASLVVSNKKTPIIADAHVQLWIAKEIVGRPSTGAHRTSTAMNVPDSRTSSVSPRTDSIDFLTPTSTKLSSADALFSSPDPFGGAVGNMSLQGGRGVDSSTPTMATTFQARSSRNPPRSTSLASSPMSNSSPRHNSMSLSSSTSHGSRTTRVAVNLGDQEHGLTYRRPLRPMVVLFLKTPDQKLSFVTIHIDEDTGMNAERCNCRISGKDCPISAIERAGGKKDLLAQRYDADGSEDWDITLLGTTKRAELPDHAFKGLQRVSIKFENVGQRKEFGGWVCRCNPTRLGELQKCVQAGHQGLFGEVKQHGRKEMQTWHREQDARREIVLGEQPQQGLR
ncbi:hypothetical protein NA57DRAFT_31033 [Rhizodiscina lignyota]|uniref:Uncharacterized protein n=1 Tax=Rhizodiscina lignyota TaxID=1504668 RepID=A0A9P4IPN5_9PEZI|nr:hypothetical protein NA57DRAFT_31033 [Rhizodiscina lignyota]